MVSALGSRLSGPGSSPDHYTVLLYNKRYSHSGSRSTNVSKWVLKNEMFLGGCGLGSVGEGDGSGGGDLTPQQTTSLFRDWD